MFFWICFRVEKFKTNLKALKSLQVLNCHTTSFSYSFKTDCVDKLYLPVHQFFLFRTVCSH